MRKKMVVALLLLWVLTGCEAMYYDPVAAKQERRKKEVALKQKVRADLLAKNPDWPENIKENILAGKIILGMDQKQVIASWGFPDDMNESVGSWGKHEQWVYGEWNPKHLYFEEGILTSWQD